MEMNEEKIFPIADPKKQVQDMFEALQKQYGEDFPVMIVSLVARVKRQEDLLKQVGETVNKLSKKFSAMKVVNHIRSLLKTLSSNEK